MNLLEHKKELDKLENIKTDLIKLIAGTNDSKLMDKFMEYQNQKIKCNESLIKCFGK